MATNQQTSSEDKGIPKAALQGETTVGQYKRGRLRSNKEDKGIPKAALQGETTVGQYKRGRLRSNKEEAKPVRAGRNPKLNGKVQLSFSTCAKSITNVNISRRGLLALEMAVGLAIFLDFGAANRAAKQMVMDVYSKAGYECQNHDGKDYKTVRRRIDASAGLYGKITDTVIAQWIDGKSESKLLQSIAHEISKIGFRNMEDVLDYLGRPNSRTQAGQRTESAEASIFDITVGEGKVVHIPHTLNESELLELAHKIMALADAMHMKELDENGTYIGPDRRVVKSDVEQERRKGPASLH